MSRLRAAMALLGSYFVLFGMVALFAAPFAVVIVKGVLSWLF